ncbi:hypothetical protein ACHWQZ_G001761 [Mnemiopsis leidyi]
MASGHYSLGVFLDIESAFDAVSHTAIKEALTKADIPPTIVNWISFMVSNRFITLSYCDTSLTRKVTKGSPQGGVLSPLLWNLTLNTFLNSLGIHSSFIQAFADDLVILIRGICKSTITEVAQKHLNNINRWCNTKGLKLSAIKSTAILFTNKRDNTLEVPLTISGYQIPVVNSTVYLGVTLDNKLGWGQHILRKCDTANSQLQACKRAVGKTWGLTPAGIKWIYNQVIIPSVMYSAITWHHTVEQKLYLKQRLTTLQRNAALSITRGLKSSPTDNLEILAGLQPIHLKLKETAIKAALRLKLNNTWISNHCLDRSKAKKSHAYNIDKTITNIPFSKCHITDLIPEVTVLDRRFSIQINDRLKAKDHPLNLSRNTWQIFTDGSKQGHNTGAGFTVIKHLTEHHATHFSLGTIATVYQSELFAINMGTIWAINNINPHSDIAIFSDSQAVIKALNNPQVKSRMILETINSLNTLGNNNTVSINWIPGHEGVPGNERADELARQGSSTRPVGPEPFVPLPTSFITREIHNSLTNSHLKEYNKAKLSEKAPKLPSGRQGFDADTLREMTQKSLNSINAWCKKSGLKLSHLKSHCVMFTNRRSWSFDRPLKVDGAEISVLNSTKFLGLTLDSKNNWNEHIDNLYKKTKCILMQCRRAVGPTWGFKPATMRWVYNAMVKPVLSYGSTIWINGTKTKRNQTLLNGVQRLANVIITGALPTTPGTALDVIRGRSHMTSANFR